MFSYEIKRQDRKVRRCGIKLHAMKAMMGVAFLPL
jgi:hypothetical protein